LRRIGFAGVLLALALAFPGAALAAGSHQIQVLTSGSTVLTTFSSAKCEKRKASEGTNRIFHAISISKNRNYRLDVTIFDFKGFLAEYELNQGSIDPAPGVFLTDLTDESGNGNYSNAFEPPYPSFGFGEIAFRHGGKLMGVGYGPAMYTADASDAVLLTGVVECKYKKKRRPGKR
jgi:hypothetical protein